MALNINFGKTNKLMQTLMWYFMQSKLGKESHERSMLRQQQYQTGIEERGIATHERGLARIAETDKRMRERAEQDAIRTIQMNPKLQSLRQTADMPQLVGEEKSNQARVQYEQIVDDVSLALFNMMKQGDPKIEDFKSIVASFDPTQITSLSRHAATTAKFKEELPLQKRGLEVAETRERRLGEPEAMKPEAVKAEKMFKFYESREKSLMAQLKKAAADLDTKREGEIGAKLSSLRSKMEALVQKIEQSYGVGLKPEVTPTGMTDEDKIAFLTNYLMTTHNIPPEEAARLAREAILGTGTIQ